MPDYVQTIDRERLEYVKRSFPPRLQRFLDISSVSIRYRAIVLLAARIIPELVYVIHAVCDVITVGPHAAEGQLLDRSALSELLALGGHVDLHDGSLPEGHILKGPEDASLVSRWNCHRVRRSNLRDTKASGSSFGSRAVQNQSRLAASRPNLHVIYISNFKYGPDSYIKHFTREAAGSPL